jgi:cytochrome c peroxidase
VNGPALSLSEMGSTWEEIVKKLMNSPSYRVEFDKLYPDGVKPANVRNSIAEFERSLLTPNARFDKFLLGDDNAINAQEKSGYRKFRSFGCASCHQGINVGGNMFETLGAMADYFKDRGGLTQADLGRFNITHKEEDRYVFKVPSLRNVELTAPYFHDGSMTTLGEAVQAMAKYQLGRPLSKGDVADIVAFLKTLTGEYQGRKL